MKIGTLTFLFLLSTLIALGQKEYLKLNNTCKTTYSPFTSVQIIDNRINNQTLGFIQVGISNEVKQLKFIGSLIDSIAQFYEVNKNDTLKNDLVILLNQFYVSEYTGKFKETGNFEIDLRFFRSNDGFEFKEILKVDTTYNCYKMDVTDKLLNEVSLRLCEIKTQVFKCNKSLFNISYTLNELKNITEIDKKRIPIYTANNFKKGIYRNFNQFKNNTPDSVSILIDSTKSAGFRLFKLNKKGVAVDRIDIENIDIYAAYDGITFVIATSEGIYRLNKINTDFYFTGKTANTTTKTNNLAVVPVAMMFGGIAGAIALDIIEYNAAKKNHYLFKINSNKGNAIPLTKQ